jgi:TPR repeat protein
VIPLYYRRDESKKELIVSNIDKLKNMAYNGDPFAAEEYARCCINFKWLGLGENDYEEAIKMFKKAMELGDNSTITKHCLAMCYLNGNGTAVDKTEARRLLEEAAAMGYEPAKEDLNKYFG